MLILGGGTRGKIDHRSNRTKEKKNDTPTVTATYDYSYRHRVEDLISKDSLIKPKFEEIGRELSGF